MIILVFAALFVAGMIMDRVAGRHPLFGCWWFGGLAIACTALAVIRALSGQWGYVAWDTILAVVNGYWWNRYRKRRKRRRALAMAGAKSRARIQAITAKQRAAQHRTRPALRPVPGGTPA